jgi:hypothetical protein
MNGKKENVIAKNKKTARQDEIQYAESLQTTHNNAINLDAPSLPKGCNHKEDLNGHCYFCGVNMLNMQS